MSDNGPTFVSTIMPPSAGPTGDKSVRHCEVCGTALDWTPGHGRPPRFCEDHKPTASRNRSDTATTGNNNNKGKTTKTTNNKKATEDQWSAFMTIVLMGGTYMLARFAAGGQGLMLTPPPGITNDQLDYFSDEFAMHEDEVGPIAAFISSRVTPTNFNKRFGHVIVSSLELEEVGAALFDYGKRIAPLLADRLAGKNTAGALVQAHTVQEPIHIRRQPPAHSTPTPQPQPQETRPANGTVTAENTGDLAARLVAENNERLRAASAAAATAN